MDENISICMSAKEAWEELMSGDNDGTRLIVARYAYDDDDKIWWIFAERNNDTVDLTLETSSDTISSTNCGSQTSVQEAIDNLLETAKSLNS